MPRRIGRKRKTEYSSLHKEEDIIQVRTKIHRGKIDSYEKIEKRGGDKKTLPIT